LPKMRHQLAKALTMLAVTRANMTGLAMFCDWR
jgi:hypothetical protein